MNEKQLLGSMTAKGGFNNEKEICKKFNNWQSDVEAQKWLDIMGYSLNLIKHIQAIQVPTRIKKSDCSLYHINDEDYQELSKFKKADAQIKIMIQIGDILKIENISIKKANHNANYNQIDKRPVLTYQNMWNFDDELSLWLQLFTGAIHYQSYLNLFENQVFKDDRRIFINEMPLNIQSKIINFFVDNKILIISDLLKGRGGLSANWFMVTQYNSETNSTKWILKDINTAMNFFGQGDVKISPKGSLTIGKITMQRKGGTPDPTSLQFKCSPCDLFDLE